MLTLTINSLTHHALREPSVRQLFVQTAVGRVVLLVAQPCPQDARCVAAYVDGRRIGNVMRDDTLLAHRGLLASAAEVLTGRIRAVEGEGYRLLVDCGDVELVDETEALRYLPQGLEGWTTSVAAMPLPALTQEASVMLRLLQSCLVTGAHDEVERLVERLYEVMCYDFSAEMQAQRRLLCRNMLASADARLHAAAHRLEEASQRMGGDHQMEAVATWLRDVVTRGAEANWLLAATPREVSRARVQAEADALPWGLAGLWRSDMRAFVSVAYGMRLPRRELWQVLSCLIWLERTQAELHAGPTLLGVDEIVGYCKRCVAWDEAGPVMTMLGTLLSGRATSEELAQVEGVKADFRERMKSSVTLHSPRFGGPMYDVSGNSQVMIGGTGNG